MTSPAAFAVRTTSFYDRLSSKLQKSHRDFDAVERDMATILSQDPYNRTRRHHNKKLEQSRRATASSGSDLDACVFATTS